MNQPTQILIERLEEKGMGSEEIPGLIKNLTNALLANPQSNHLHLRLLQHVLNEGFERLFQISMSEESHIGNYSTMAKNA